MAGLFWLDTGLSGADQFLQKPEAIAAAERLAESFPAGSSDPVQVLTTGVPGQVVAAIEDVDGVVRADLSDSGGDITQIDAVIEAAPGSADSRAAVIAIRSAVGNLDGTSVGGTEAQALDAADAASRDRLLILPLIALLVLGALTVLLRSLVAPVLLVLTVVATYLASLGLSWWLFTGVFDFPALDVGVPLLAFLFLVALGVDYNIFLVSRASEEAAEHGARVGMLRALTATGGVITSAGVLLDTLLVRTLVVPALGVALGEWFWWPRHVGTAAVESGTEQPLVTM